MAEFQNSSAPNPESGDKKANGVQASGQGLAGLLQKSKDIQIPNWVPVALVLTVAAAMALFFYFGQERPPKPEGPGTTFSQQQDPNALLVEVLPQTVRSFDGGEISNPFASLDSVGSLGELRVTGIIINSNGRGTAIIESAEASYIVGVGDPLSEAGWVVSQIDGNSVTFTLDGNNKTIYMDK